MAKQTILFLTNNELGQASVVLAVAHELLIRQYNIHIASFPRLKDSVSQLNTKASAVTPSATTATFHTFPGRSMVDAATENNPTVKWFNAHEIGVFGAPPAYDMLFNFLAVWSGDEYIAVYNKCIELIEQVRPSIVVVEPVFAQGIDACRMLNCKYAVLSPNTAKDHVMQPMLGSLWKYPVICSGYPFPLPWKYILPNAYLAIRAGLKMANSPALKGIDERRHAEGIVGPYPLIMTSEKNPVQVLMASRAEIDFPCFVPEHITRCGPILRPEGPIAEECPELASWLSQGPTILINLGSNVCFCIEQAQKFADALRILLDARPDIQVLWKLRPAIEDGGDADWVPTAIKSILDDVTSGRVRVEEWLPVAPTCILQSGKICCMVHHGGANSYNEAVKAGVPQIILPVWYDCYDFATRVDYLGIGIWASKATAPAINEPELREAFLRILYNDEGTVIKDKAREIAKKLGSSEGRVVACEKLIELIDD